jgi:hypothetical protein
MTEIIIIIFIIFYFISLITYITVGIVNYNILNRNFYGIKISGRSITYDNVILAFLPILNTILLIILPIYHVYKKMKKLFRKNTIKFNVEEIDPFGEEDWNEIDY